MSKIKLKTFWDTLQKPFFCLAPMADVTDAAFRRIIAKYGRPDVMWTEFVSADGLCHPIAREKLLIDLAYTEAERPIVAQLFGGNPEKMKEAAALCATLGFDGIDINMGCPDRSIEKQGAGAATIKNPELARRVIRAAHEGAHFAGRQIPISIKTRIGHNKNEFAEWIPVLLSENLAALTIHLRTRKEMSLVPAHWELMPEIIALRDKISPNTLIIGNGDVRDLAHARELAKKYGCDGVMLGRAIFGNPWVFSQSEKTHGLSSHMSDIWEDRESRKFWLHTQTHIPLAEKLRVMVEHTKLFEKLLGGVKSFSIIKKHYKAYINGFDARPTGRSFGRGAKELREKLYAANSASEVEKVVNKFLLTSK